MKTARPPADLTSSVTACARVPLKSATTTAAPSEAKRRTVAAPMPAPPAVTIATRSCSLPGIFFVGAGGNRATPLAGAAGGWAGHHVGRDAGLLFDRLFELLHVDLIGESSAVGFLLRVGPQAGVHAVEIVVDFDVERVAAPSDLHRLIDELAG